MNTTVRQRRFRRGAVSVLVLVFLSMFATMAIAYGAATQANVDMANNAALSSGARFQAESGMSYYLHMVRQVPPAASAQTMLDNIASTFETRLNGSPSLNGVVTYDGTTLTIPEIQMSDGSAGFSGQISLTPEGNISIVANGRDGSISRTVGMQGELVPGGSGVFDYGIAAGGKVRLTGNASVEGANSADEAHILSATFDDPEAFKLTGNCDIEGDIFAANPNASVSLTGNVSIGGVSCRDDDIVDHIHFGATHEEFPEVDPTVFEPFATNIVTSQTRTNGNRSFSNIRIQANADPTFSGNITLSGVVYIEQPNRVHFSGNVNITGVIVTEDAGDDNYDDCTLKFTGNTSVTGVENLPDTPEYHELRQMPGAFLLAPGFGVEFTGNFGTVSGCLAAEKFKWTGNAGGHVDGMILSYGPEEFKLTGNSHLTIDRSQYDNQPPGFACPATFVILPGSYREY